MQLMKRDHLIRILNASILKNGFYFSFIRHRLTYRLFIITSSWATGGKQKWTYSLRSIGDLDVGALAVEYGGGGHVNAAGFSLSHNPFLLT